MLGDDVVVHMMAIATAAQPDASIAWEERGHALISIEDARRVVDLAAASASAAWCGIDWQRANFEPLMSAEGRLAARNQEALTYIAKLHDDVAKGMFERDLRATSGCPAKQKARRPRFLVSRWKSNALVLAAVEGGLPGRSPHAAAQLGPRQARGSTPCIGSAPCAHQHLRRDGLEIGPEMHRTLEAEHAHLRGLDADMAEHRLVRRLGPCDWPPPPAHRCVRSSTFGPERHPGCPCRTGPVALEDAAFHGAPTVKGPT